MWASYPMPCPQEAFRRFDRKWVRSSSAWGARRDGTMTTGPPGSVDWNVSTTHHFLFVYLAQFEALEFVQICEILLCQPPVRSFFVFLHRCRKRRLCLHPSSSTYSAWSAVDVANENIFPFSVILAVAVSSLFKSLLGYSWITELFHFMGIVLFLSWFHSCSTNLTNNDWRSFKDDQHRWLGPSVNCPDVEEAYAITVLEVSTW